MAAKRKARRRAARREGKNPLVLIAAFLLIVVFGSLAVSAMWQVPLTASAAASLSEALVAVMVLSGIISLVLYFFLYDKLVAPVVFGWIYLLIALVILAFALGTGQVSQSYQSFGAEAAVLLAFSIAVFVYLWIYKGCWITGLWPDIGKIARSLGLSPDRISLRNIGIGLLMAAAVFALEIVVGLISTATNTAINTNDTVMLIGAPAWFLFFIAVIEPINEEVLFRGFMVPRVGIVISAVLFGVGHAGYNSTFAVEVIAAFIFGLIAGYAYKRTNSLYPSIIAHIIVNSIAVAGFLFMPTGVCC
ncbi:MAG: CPBP family intramembrane metalloprotease [Candidatus Micrarchaeota archaeon]|nr:CPBP family intramembrane metalloprotease [Candidatus Micrarchaeota archaeon]